MKAEKIKRLLGAPTFPMIATDKSRREEFIRMMLEVAAKTVGVALPDLPISEMITVRRGTEEMDQPGAAARKAKEGETGFQDVPYDEVVSSSDTVASDDSTIMDAEAVGSKTTTETATGQEIPARTVSDRSKILHLLAIVPTDGVPDVFTHVSYIDEVIDENAIASLISALDSFGGIDGQSIDGTSGTNALETIEHEGNLVMVEKSAHFVMALIVTNDSQEDEQRKILNSLLVDLEQKYQNVWATWNGSTSIFEPSIFDILARVPLRPISLDYLLRAREAGRPLPFSNREVGTAIVAVQSAIAQNDTIGGLVRSLNLPREIVLGCLQILNYYGWVDFKVEIGPTSVLKKVGVVSEETEKAYGQAVIKFVDFCDGQTSLEDVVRKISVSLQAMKFVATKLVLDGVLEIVA
jgi:hypothetical protein